MAPRVTPTPIDADNLSGSTMPAVPIDWRSGDADSMSARATYSEPTTDAGYTTAGSTQSVDHSINLLRWRGSPYRLVRRRQAPSPDDRIVLQAAACRQGLSARSDSNRCRPVKQLRFVPTASRY